MITEECISCIKATDLQKDDILVVKLNFGRMPTHRAEKYASDVKTSLQKMTDAKILIMSTESSIEVFKKED